MKAILIPVKEFHEAKKRLAPHFSPTDRAALAQAMCEDFFNVVAATSCADRVFVISKERRALFYARQRGWETIIESRQVSESSSIDAGSRYCAERGVQALLRLPVDLPLVEPSDIEAIFERLDVAPSVVIVPSSDGSGTNALLRSPAELFPSHFGPNSFPRHLAEAEGCGARIRVFRNPRLELDIDELEDLCKLQNRLRPGSATAQWLIEREIHFEAAVDAGRSQMI
ncbi:MAG TPA: 2-phospho-L-lactate guanylyltransferase [Candidatus Dormibacteraeota bacterium]|nr:2-phospho-L-lactate guanylyltransferase [Candidatus Dormibacteraeota bacterium]